ncbi:Nonribosomal peptide synthetase fmpE [Colletotrichum viniferum]|nr:Nonribosomal peptide synthetase fmpE [Colletotrichum viniferum]
MDSEFSVEKAREQFPSLQKDQIFGDNAGGSQVLGSVAYSISEYLITNNVQLGATYSTSRTSTAKFDEAYRIASQYINAGIDEIVIGASTTQVLRNLAASIKLEAGDELILSEIDHESNIDPWLHYAQIAGANIKWWSPADRSNPKLDAKTLQSLLTTKTRLVACTHASNILGSIHDIKAIADTVHEIPDALLCVDGVAYAPHRAIDVKELGADFYAFSWYKVYGPHISLLYGSRKAQEQLKPLGHYFNPSASLMDKLELAGASYELTQSIIPLVAYFGKNPKKTWDEITQHEEKLQKRLIEYLDSRPDISIRGETSSEAAVRLPTVSFTVRGKSSQSVVEAIETQSNIGIRWGHFFSKRLAERTLGLDDDGVVRVSLVHYNTDLRDGNQSLINLLTVEQKWEYFQMLVSIGYKEIEVSFPAASQIEFDFTRRLIETPGTVSDDVRIRGLSPTREGSVRFLRSLTKDDPESAYVTHWTLAFGLEAYNEADPEFALLITEAVKEAWGGD